MFANEKRIALGLAVLFGCQVEAALAVMPPGNTGGAPLPGNPAPNAVPVPAAKAPVAPQAPAAQSAPAAESKSAAPAKPMAPPVTRSAIVQKLIYRGIAFERAGDFKTAEKIYRDAYAAAQTQNVAEGDQTISILEYLRGICLKQKKYPEAIAFAKSLTEVGARVRGEHNIRVAADLKTLADLELANGKFDEAKQSYLNAVATANGAPAAGFATTKNPTPQALSGYLAAKRNLVLAIYDGLTRCLDKNDDPSTGEDAYTGAIQFISKIKDKEFPTTSAQAFLVQKYHAYLALIQRPDDAADLDKQLDEVFRRQEANRTYGKDSRSKS